jgi:hypothetical protein
MPTTQLPVPINGYSDSLNHQHGADGFSTSMMNVVPSDNWEHRRRVGTRQGFAALLDMGSADDQNIQEMVSYEVYRDTTLRREVLIVSGATGANSDTGIVYMDQGGVTNDIEYSATAATATITVTGTPTAGKGIIITATAGTVVTVTAHAATTSMSTDTGLFAVDGGTTALIAEDLKTCITAHSRLTATRAGSVVTVTQAVATATSTGNTEITAGSGGDLDNATYTNFSGAAYTNGTGRIQKYDTVRGLQFGNFVYLATGRHYYKIDLTASTPVVEEWTNYNGTGNLPEDTVGNKCSLITRFGGRIAMSGLSSSPNNWFMSAIGDPDDWTPTTDTSYDAQAGDTSTNFGKLGEPITALFPFGESGLMMASRNTLTYLTSDPVVSGAQFIRMSNGVGVMGADAWCQGPEKTCYVASGDGVYMIQPNDFNIQRGQSVTTARLDGFFAGVNPSEVDIHLAYDPPRSMIFMFVNRENDPSNVVHYQHHIPTQSWWSFQISDPRMDVIRATCLYTPVTGEREGTWYGCKSGRVAMQPNSGVLSYDGSAHVSALKTGQPNDPNSGEQVAFASRLAWSPINAGLSNERLLITELDVLLDTHEVTATAGITPSGPTLSLYAADMAQRLSGVSGDIGVTETRLAITGGAADATIDSTIDCGNGDTKAYAVITVADGDATDHGIAELQYITLTDNETVPVTKTYVVTDNALGGVSTGTVLVEGSDYGSGTLGAGHPLIGGIAVRINTTGSIANARTFLVQLKAAIEDSDGHNGKIVVSTVSAGVAATATFVGTADLDDASGTSLILTNADASTVTFTTDPTLNFGDTTADIGDTAATATIVGTADLDDEDGTDFILTNADGSTVTFHTDPTKNFGDTSNDDGDHRWIINTRDIEGGDEVRKATQAIHIACLTAIAAGELDMTAVPSTDTGSQTSFTLTQTTTGTAGNKPITLVTGVTANGETAFTGGFDQRWRVNTRDISGGSEVRKATQAFWIACKGAIDAGELDMTIDPASFAGTEEEFTLTQTTGGTAGNTAITLITGMTANGETAFTGAGFGEPSMTLTQYTAFRGGNTPITETIASSVTIPSTFVGGQTTAVGTEYSPAIVATIGIYDYDIDNLDGETMIFNDLSSSTAADVTLTFDKTLGVDASTASKIGCADVDGNGLGIMQGIKKSIDLNYNAGLLNIKTEEPTAGSTPDAEMKLRCTDSWNGYDLLSDVDISGTAVDSNDIQGEDFDLALGTNWKQFITGGNAPLITGAYTLEDSAASESRRKWSQSSMYTVRMSGNTTGTDPDQFEGNWGVFPTEAGAPLYMASEPTATLALSTITSTEILPSGFTASTAIIDPQQDDTSKRTLNTWALIRGRNNRIRTRYRESDFQVEISATGTNWVLEDIAANIEQGGKYRTVV